MTDNNDTECDVENCSYWVPEGMEYIMEDHYELHDIIKQAYINGYRNSLWELYDRNDDEIPQWAEDSFQFVEEYDWWDTDD